MATFTISLAGSSVVNGSKTWTVSDADVQELIDYMALKYAPGTTFGNRTPLAPAQALLAWAQGFVTNTIAELKRDKMQKAQAALNVAPITFT